MARRSIRSGRRSGPRRATFWETASSTTLPVLTEGGTVAIVQTLVLESELDSVPNPTLVRVRGQIFAHLMSASNAVGDALLLSHAIMVVDAKQLAIGITAMPLPLSSNSEDFLWFGSQFMARSTLGSATDGAPPSWDRIEVDSKAMRKITLNQVLVLVSEMVGLAGAGQDCRFGLNLRMLFKK